jgi:hypothetical protein
MRAKFCVASCLFSLLAICEMLEYGSIPLYWRCTRGDLPVIWE